jgi:nicotinate-nucleotide pyrophosphorylase (carboxylating)
VQKPDKLQLSEEQIAGIIDRALAEDISHGDVTSEAVIPPDLHAKATVLVKAAGVLAGIEVARQVFHRVDPSLEVDVLVKDGSAVQPGDIVATVAGRATSILKAERVALNFLQHLSGIASETDRYVRETKGYDVRITETRKTTPGLRALEKYAVRLGGGQNHRFHLGDGVLIKDNHLVALRALGMRLAEIVARAKQNTPEGMKVEVEVNTVAEAKAAIEGGADIILLDNMSPDEMRRVAAIIPPHAKTEASGGITLANVGAVAAAGVDFISVGALTHSVKALDISLELEPQTLRPLA